MLVKFFLTKNFITFKLLASASFYFEMDFGNSQRLLLGRNYIFKRAIRPDLSPPRKLFKLDNSCPRDMWTGKLITTGDRQTNLSMQNVI